MRLLRLGGKWMTDTEVRVECQSILFGIYQMPNEKQYNDVY